MKHIKRFNEGFERIEPEGGLRDLWYKMTHPLQDYGPSGMGTAELVNRKISRKHAEKFKNEPAPTGTNAADCVGTLDYKKCPISDNISNEILSKLESGIFNIESVERVPTGFLFKLKEIPGLWMVTRGPTSNGSLLYLEKDGKKIESHREWDSQRDNDSMLVGLHKYMRDLPKIGDQLDLPLN